MLFKEQECETIFNILSSQIRIQVPLLRNVALRWRKGTSGGSNDQTVSYDTETSLPITSSVILSSDLKPHKVTELAMPIYD